VVPESYWVARCMLAYGTMSRTALALVMVAASASAASAGGFVGLGIGTGAASSSDGFAGDFDVDEDGRSGRLLVGYSFGRFAIEGMGTRYGMVDSVSRPWTGTTLSLHGKFTLPLQDSFGVFGRLGLQRTDINGDEANAEMSGSGFLVGAGAEFKLPVQAVGLAIYIDYTIFRSSLETEWNAQEVTLTSRIWTLGANLSF
jgi:hypothetical protein